MILRAKLVAYPFHLEPRKILVKVFYTCEQMSDDDKTGADKIADGKNPSGSCYLGIAPTTEPITASLGYFLTRDQEKAASWRSIVGADSISTTLRMLHRVMGDNFQGRHIEFSIDDDADVEALEAHLGKIIDAGLCSLQRGAADEVKEARDVRPAGDIDES